MRTREREGRPSFWKRPSRALPDREETRREDDASRPMPAGDVKRLVKNADNPRRRGANNSALNGPLRSDNSRPLAHHHFDKADEYGRNRQAKHDRLHPQQEVAKLVVVLCWVEPVRQCEDDEGRPKQPPQTSQTEPSCTRYHCVASCAPMT